MKPVRTLLMLTASLVFSFSPAFGGVLMESAQQPAQGGLIKSLAFMDGNRMRIETSGAGQNQTIIFRGDKKVMWMIDKTRQTAQEITAADIQQAGRAMDDAMSKMRAQLAQMPPKQRQMMEQMMKGQMGRMQGAGQVAKTVYKKTGSGIKVGKWVCDKYEGFRNGTKVKELYTIDGARFGLKKESLSIMQEMARFFKPMTKGNVSKSPGFLLEDSSVKGLPVRVINFKNGVQSAVTNITAVTKKNFASSSFELPAGIRPTRPMADAFKRRMR